MLKLSEWELADLGKKEGVKLHQGKGTPLFLKGKIKCKNERRSIYFEVDTGADCEILSF